MSMYNVHNTQKGDAIKAIIGFSGRITYLLMHVHTDYHIVGTHTLYKR